ncbi:hypothetical protein YC2023_062227 [Brassica napus]
MEKKFVSHWICPNGSISSFNQEKQTNLWHYKCPDGQRRLHFLVSSSSSLSLKPTQKTSSYIETLVNF